MKRTAWWVAGLVLLVLSFWMQHESARGTFDILERRWVDWLAANVASDVVLPPLTLVLYDEEDSAVAGSAKMGVLDRALFARAAGRLGAGVAVVEGLPGDPRRVIEAAGTIPVLGAYMWDEAPASGWTGIDGEARLSWRELPGLVGRPTQCYRGFFDPPSGWTGAREIQLVARSGDRGVPSVLALVWGLVHGKRPGEIFASGAALRAGSGLLPVNDAGAARFWPESLPSVVSLNGFLLEAERFEREGGQSPVRGHVVMLARATAEVARVFAPGETAQTPAERWAAAWEAAAGNRIFLRPAWWFAAGLAAMALLLTKLSCEVSLLRGTGLGAFVVLLYALSALAAYGGSRLLLPIAPVLILILASVVASRVLRQPPIAP